MLPNESSFKKCIFSFLENSIENVVCILLYYVKKGFAERIFCDGERI